MPYAQANLIASLIEEEDFSGSLGEVLHQIARRVQRMTFSDEGRELVLAALSQVDDALQAITSDDWESQPMAASAAERLPGIAALRERCLRRGGTATGGARRHPGVAGQRRADVHLIERIDAERRSVPRVVPADALTAEPVPADLEHAAPAPASPRAFTGDPAASDSPLPVEAGPKAKGIICASEVALCRRLSLATGSCHCHSLSVAPPFANP